MSKLVSGVLMLLATLPAWADEAAVAAVPRAEADPTALIVSAALFFGMIGAFVGYLWWKDQASKKKAVK